MDILSLRMTKADKQGLREYKRTQESRHQQLLFLHFGITSFLSMLLNVERKKIREPRMLPVHLKTTSKIAISA